VVGQVPLRFTAASQVQRVRRRVGGRYELHLQFITSSCNAPSVLLIGLQLPLENLDLQSLPANETGYQRIEPEVRVPAKMGGQIMDSVARSQTLKIQEDLALSTPHRTSRVSRLFLVVSDENPRSRQKRTSNPSSKQVVGRTKGFGGRCHLFRHACRWFSNRISSRDLPSC